MTRKEYNSIILGIIADAIQQYPDMRFGQILANLNIIQYKSNTFDETIITLDPFNIESKQMLSNIKQSSFYKKL